MLLIIELNPFYGPQFDLLRQLQSAQCVRHQAAPETFNPFGAPFGAASAEQPSAQGHGIQASRLDELERAIGRVFGLNDKLARDMAVELTGIRQHLGTHDGRLNHHEASLKSTCTAETVAAVSKSLASLSGELAALRKDVADLKARFVTGAGTGAAPPHSSNNVASNNGHVPKPSSNGHAGANGLDIEKH